MFGFKSKAEGREATKLEMLEEDRDCLKREVKALKQDKTKLKEEVTQLELDAKIADEDIKHMIKMKTESMELDFKKREVESDAKKATEIATVKDNYQAKVEKQLVAEGTKMEKMYGQILERLPNVTLAMKQNDKS